MRRLTTFFFALSLAIGSAAVVWGDPPPDDDGISGTTVPVVPDVPAPGASAPGEQKPERYVPTFVEADFEIRPDRFVTDETITVEGVLAFDQVFSVHWDDLSQERLKLAPFKVLKIVIGPQRPSGRSDKVFADERSIRIVLALEDKEKRGEITVPAIRLSYSWQDGEKIQTETFTLGPWKVERVPIKMSVSISSSVLHLGETTELTVKITRDSDVKILNQFLGILKDEKASEAQKSEVRRWLKALEVRKESAFNFDSPELKPMTVLERSLQSGLNGQTQISVWSYTLAYYQEAKKSFTLPELKVWYILPPRTGEDEIRLPAEQGYSEPKPLSVSGLEMVIVSRLSGQDRRLDGPMPLEAERFDQYLVYFFSYGLFVVGGVLIFSGVVLVLGQRERGVRKAKTEKPINFRKASAELVVFVNQIFLAGHISRHSVVILRERMFAVLGAVVGLVWEEAQSKSADEIIAFLEKHYHRAHIAPVIDFVNWLDHALSLSEMSSPEGVELPGEMLSRVVPFLRGEALWDALAQL